MLTQSLSLLELCAQDLQLSYRLLLLQPEKVLSPEVHGALQEHCSAQEEQCHRTELAQAVFVLRNSGTSEFDRCEKQSERRNKQTWYTLYACKIQIYLRYKRVSIFKNIVKNHFLPMGQTYTDFRENLNLWSFQRKIINRQK